MARLAWFVVLALAVPTRASADVFKLFGEVHGGGMYGAGTAGPQQNQAFFANSPHGLYGALVGAEFLFFDAWIEHHQYRFSGKRLTTWTQFGLGVHTTVDLGDGNERMHHKGPYAEFGGGLWLGLGTGQQVVPPLDNAQISDKAFLLEGRLGVGTHLSKIFDLGISFPASYGYFFKTGNGATANDPDTHYRGWQVEGLVVFRVNINLF